MYLLLPVRKSLERCIQALRSCWFQLCLQEAVFHERETLYVNLVTALAEERKNISSLQYCNKTRHKQLSCRDVSACWTCANGLIGMFGTFYFMFWQPDFSKSSTRSMRRCCVMVGDLLSWPNNTRVQVYFGPTAVAAIWDYSAESPVWKQVNGQRGDFRGAVCRTGRRDGPAGRRKMWSVSLECLDKVSQWCPAWANMQSVWC